MSEIRDVFEAVNRGKNKIAQQEAERERRRQAQLAAMRAEWRRVQEQIRAALPELIRPYMRDLIDYDDEELRSTPSAGAHRVFIDIDGLVPIVTYVKRYLDNGDERWAQTDRWDDARAYTGFYTIPYPYHLNEREIGMGEVAYDFRHGTYTNDIEVALAVAAEKYQEYQSMIQAAEVQRQAAQIQAEQPVYEGVGTPVPGVNGNDEFLRQLAAFVEKIAREVLNEKLS